MVRPQLRWDNRAMAQWGIAMTWWHPIWTLPTYDEMRAGQAAIEKAMSMNAGSDRERGFITALNTYYNTPDGSAAAPVGQSCYGPMGNRDDLVASDLDTAYLRRNARGPSCNRKSDVDERRFGSRARLHHRAEHLL